MRTLILALALVCASFAAHAEPSAKSLDLARKIMAVQMQQSKANIDQLNATMRAKVAAEPDPAKREVLTKMFGDNFFTQDDIAQITESVAKSMASKFTEAELTQIYAFNTSPVGVKMADYEHNIKSEMMPAMLQIMGRKMSAAGASMKQ